MKDDGTLGYAIWCLVSIPDEGATREAVEAAIAEVNRRAEMLTLTGPPNAVASIFDDVLQKATANPRPLQK